MKNLTRITLIEPFDHSEVLYVLCELLLEQDVELWVFCQIYILEDGPEVLRSHPNIHWHTFAADNRKQFFFQQRVQLNQCQLLIWITAPPSAYRWINGLKLRAPVVLLLHNLHTWIAPWKNLQLCRSSVIAYLSDSARLARFFFWQRPQQQRLLKKAVAIGVPSQKMLELVNRSSGHGQLVEAFVVPFAYSQSRNHHPEDEGVIRVVIPGIVSENGRNYLTVAKAFRQSLPQLNKPVNLILLGKVEDIQVIQPFKALEQKYSGFELTHFTERLPQRVYDEYLEKTHFMILPYTAGQKFGIIREKWGESKISGGISDMIRFSIPAICSAHYHLDTQIESLTASFSTQDELTQLLIDWVNKQGYRSHRLSTLEMDKTALSAQLLRELSRLIQ